MNYQEYTEAIESIDQNYRKTEIVSEDYIAFSDCRNATDQEKFTLAAWKSDPDEYLNWLENNGFTLIGEGTLNKVYAKDDFVVKVIKKKDTRIKHNCYCDLKYTSHTIGYSSVPNIAKSYILLRQIFIEHILYPTLMSKDYMCCIQTRLEKDDEKVTKYFNKILNPLKLKCKDLGPFENLAWSTKDKKAYIIDIW